MARRSKKYVEAAKKAVVKDMVLLDAVKQAKKNSYSKFKGTLTLHLAINVPKDKEAKSIKGSIALPHSSSTKTVRIAVFTTADKVEAALKAGADKAGLEDLIKEIKGGKIDFDIAMATPDVMPKIAILGKELGPKGLMPNPKTGTVTNDIAKTVEEYKKGKLNFACDESGVLHFPVGKVDLDDEKIVENIHACIEKSAEVVGKTVKAIIKSIHVAPTMGKSIKVTYVEDVVAE